MIFIEWTVDIPGMPPLHKLLQRIAEECLLAEGLSGKYQVGLTITTDESIQALNRTQRGIDRATDVLSFPTAHYPPGKTAREIPKRLRRELDPDTGRLNLGDVVISWPRVIAQATAFGHSGAREAGFLFAHGLLHLMGYDHLEVDDTAKMRAMEENILAGMRLPRGDTPGRERLIALAKQAMRYAYAPYSRYAVGACVLATDGRVFQGCNVENASYGLTVCAERNAVNHMIAQGGWEIAALAVAADGGMPYPCGACRQVLREFARADTPVYIVCGETVQTLTLGHLLPDSFGPAVFTGAVPNRLAPTDGPGAVDLPENKEEP